jgi:hypothetical protein
METIYIEPNERDVICERLASTAWPTDVFIFLRSFGIDAGERRWRWLSSSRSQRMRCGQGAFLPSIAARIAVEGGMTKRARARTRRHPGSDIEEDETLLDRVNECLRDPTDRWCTQPRA